MIMYTTLASATFHARLQHMHRQHMNMEWAIWHYGCCDKIYTVLNPIYGRREWFCNWLIFVMIYTGCDNDDGNEDDDGSDNEADVDVMVRW